MSTSSCDCGNCNNPQTRRPANTAGNNPQTRRQATTSGNNASNNSKHVGQPTPQEIMHPATAKNQFKDCSNDCECCEIFGITYGETLLTASNTTRAVVASAFAAFAAGGPNPTDRLVPLQEFNIAASKIVSAAFTEVDISSDCCVGYSASIKNGLIAVFNLTVSNIFIPTIPIGSPLPPYCPPGQQCVYKNIAIALALMEEIVATAKLIASGD